MRNACIALVAISLIACGDDDATAVTDAAVDSAPPVSDAETPIDAGACTHTVTDLQGGWLSPTAERRTIVCFNGTDLWIVDTAAELANPAPCTVSADGCSFMCEVEGEQFTGTWTLSTDMLTGVVDPCAGNPAACTATYGRDSNLSCG